MSIQEQEGIKQPEYLNDIPFPDDISYSPAETLQVKHAKSRDVKLSTVEKRELANRFSSLKEVEFDLERQHPLLREYVSAMCETTDAKPQALMTAYLPAIAANIGNRAYILNRMRRQPCNIWSLIIAPSTLGRKTTVLDLPMKPLYEYNDVLEQQYEHDLEIYGKEAKNLKRQYIVLPSATSERFISILKDNPNGILKNSEFHSFLMKSQKSYNGDLKSLLIDSFDSGRIFTSTISRGDETARNIAFSMTNASTKELFLDASQKYDAKSGFLQRMLFCNCHDINIDDLDLSYSSGDIAAEYIEFFVKPLYNGLRVFTNFYDDAIHVKLSDEAQAIFERIGTIVFKGMKAKGQQEFYSYAGRLLNDYYFRFSILFLMCAHVSYCMQQQQDIQEYAKELNLFNDFTIDKQITEYAFELSLFYLRNVIGFIQAEFQDTKSEQNLQKVMKVFKTKAENILTKRIIRQYAHLEDIDLERALLALVEDGYLIEDKTNRRSLKYSLSEDYLDVEEV